MSQLPEPAAPAPSPTRKSAASIIRKGWMLLLVGVVGLFAWAALAPLDAGVTAQGEIVIDSLRARVQHLGGGIVQSVRVRDGVHVQRDEVLISLDRTQAQAELAIVESRLLSSLAIEARLRAERARSPRIDFPPAVAAAADKRAIADAIQTQTQLFDSRRLALSSEQSILDENIRGVSEQIKGLQALVDGKTRQLQLLREERDSLQGLFEEGYVPRMRIFELERAISETEASRSESLAGISRAQASLGELRLRKVERDRDHDKDTETQLMSLQLEIAGLEQRRIALDDQLSRIEVRAPVSGVVVGMRVHSTGSVIRPGEEILEIVPDGQPLTVEARVATQHVELLSEGMPAMIRFSALNRLNPVVQGEVTTVSADRLTDERSGAPYFKARIRVPPEQLARLDYARIVPGMPVEIVVKTGERSLLHYLLEPVLDHLFTAFRER